MRNKKKSHTGHHQSKPRSGPLTCLLHANLHQGLCTNLSLTPGVLYNTSISMTSVVSNKLKKQENLGYLSCLICVHTVESVVVGDFVFLFVLICVEAVEAVVGWWVSLGGGVASPPSREAGFRPHIINP